jgi:hypothetical protein
MNYPIFYKGYSDCIYIMVSDENTYSEVHIFSCSTEISNSTGKVGESILAKCEPCAPEEFYMAAAQAMERLNAVLLPNLSTPAV